MFTEGFLETFILPPASWDGATPKAKRCAQFSQRKREANYTPEVQHIP